MLPTKFYTELLSANLLPKKNLGQSHFAAQLAGGVNLRTLQASQAPSTTLRAVPLPVPGRILGGHHSVHPGYFAVHAADWLSIHALQLPFARSRTRAM